MMTVVAALLAAALLAEAAAAQRPRPAARPPAARVADRWHVETSRSEMTDEPSVTLSLNATNTVEGVILQVRPSLYIRCHEQKVELYIYGGSGVGGDPGGRTSVRGGWGGEEGAGEKRARATGYTPPRRPRPRRLVRAAL